MNLAITLAAYLGFAVEALWLWEAASEKRDSQPRSIRAPGPSGPLTVVGIVAAVGMGLIGLAIWAGETPFTQKLDEILASGLLGAAMLFVLAAGFVGGWLLPRVNEYNILSVLAVVGFNTLNQEPALPAPLVTFSLVVPVLVGLALIFQRTSPTALGKVALYALYLGALILLTIQNGIYELNAQTDFSIPEAIFFGAALCFFSIHILFGLRFWVIASAMIFPANRSYASPMMNKLYRDDQIAPWLFFAGLALILSAVWANQIFLFFPGEQFNSLVVILCTQVLFRPRQTETG